MTEPASVSLYLLNFDPEPVPDLARLVGWTRAADEAGIDRVILSEHVVLGERLENYARPELGGIRGGSSRRDLTVPGWSRSRPSPISAR